MFALATGQTALSSLLPSMRLFFLPLSFAVTLLMAGLSGCATSSDSGGYHKMTTVRTGLYLEGPQQLAPANAQLDPGTRLRILEVGGDFCQVELIGGMKGFVRTADIGPIREHTGWTQ
jgi:hypothetical protein